MTVTPVIRSQADTINMCRNTVILTLHERHVISNHRQRNCFQRLAQADNNKINVPYYLHMVRGIHRWPVDFPYQRVSIAATLPMPCPLVSRFVELLKSVMSVRAIRLISIQFIISLLSPNTHVIWNQITTYQFERFLAIKLEIHIIERRHFSAAGKIFK